MVRGLEVIWGVLVFSGIGPGGEGDSVIFREERRQGKKRNSPDWGEVTLVVSWLTDDKQGQNRKYGDWRKLKRGL